LPGPRWPLRLDDRSSKPSTFTKCTGQLGLGHGMPCKGT
jgi:hypothetical protein